MNNFLLLMLSVVGLVSCKKESHSSIKEYKVTYNISGIGSNSNSSISKNASASSETVADGNAFFNITYLAYNENDVLVDSISRFINGKEGFGSIPSKLSPGKYTLVFVASKNRFLLEDINNLNSLHLLFPQDVYLEKTSITISNKNVVKDIVLEKVSGKLQIEIEDILTENVAEIQISLSNAPDKFMIKAGETASVSPLTMLVPVEQADFGKAHKVITTDILASKTALTWITITLLDGDKNVLAEKTLNDVSIVQNETTFLATKLFEYDSDETMLAAIAE